MYQIVFNLSSSVVFLAGRRLEAVDLRLERFVEMEMGIAMLKKRIEVESVCVVYCCPFEGLISESRIERSKVCAWSVVVDATDRRLVQLLDVL